MSTDDSGKKDNGKKPATTKKPTTTKSTAARSRKASESGRAAGSKKQPASKATAASKAKTGAAKTPAKKPATRKAKAPVRTLPDNVVQFPGAGDLSGLKPQGQTAALSKQSARRSAPAAFYGSPDYAISDALEFASVTAFETGDLLGEIVASALSHELRYSVHISNRDPESPTDMLLQLLNVALIKLRGLAMLIPPGRVLKDSIPNIESVEGYDGLRQVCQDNGDKIQGLLYDFFDRLYNSPESLREFDLVGAPEVIDELDEVCESVQMAAAQLDDMVSLWYDEFEDV